MVLICMWTTPSGDSFFNDHPLAHSIPGGGVVHLIKSAAAHSSASVKVFGRLHDNPIHTRRRQAFEKRQWTKSREVGRLRCGGVYEGLIGRRMPARTVERRVMPSPFWNQRAPTTR